MSEVSKYRRYALNTNASIKRRCPWCKNEYPATKKYFKGNVTKSLGLDYICKICVNKKRKNTFIEANTDERIKRKCCGCGKNYPASQDIMKKINHYH